MHTLSLHDALPISARKHGITAKRWYDQAAQDRYGGGLEAEAFVRVPDVGCVPVHAIGVDAQDFRKAFKDRKSTRLNSSHLVISYAVFCLKKKTPYQRRSPGCRPGGGRTRGAG